MEALRVDPPAWVALSVAHCSVTVIEVKAMERAR